MTNPGRDQTDRAKCPAAAAAALLLLLSSCSLDEVEIPDIDGPSTYGLGLQLSASPDIIVADGFSCREQIEQMTGRQTLHAAELAAQCLQA